MNKIKLFKSSISRNLNTANVPTSDKKGNDENQSSKVISPSKSIEIEEKDNKSNYPNQHFSEKDNLEQEEETRSSNYHNITAPLVGTFYSAPKENDPPFIKPGDKIEAGQVICIIEAMKIFNEIESEVSGIVREILIDNSSPVEYGQPIVSIDIDV